MNPVLPPVAERFLRYVQIDTQSDPRSDTVPSTEKQKDLGRLLAEELRAMGVEDVEMDEYGYVFGTIPTNLPPDRAAGLPVVGLLAHVDTSPDESGAGVRPVIHPNYQGGLIALPGDPSVKLDPARQPALLKCIGHDLITSDGTTLLGSDDKAGVAILMQLAENLLQNPDLPRPTLRICFTIDEEIGRGVDHLDLKKLGASLAYTLDGSDVDTVYAETFNAAEAIIRVKGVMVHPGYAKNVMVNAVRILAEMIAALPQAEAPETTEAREGYLHPHHIAAGDATSAEALFILRDFSWEGLDRRKDYLRVLTGLFRLRYPKAEITLDIRDQYRNMRAYIEDTDRRALDFLFETARTMGFELGLEVIRGGTDGARLSEMGIPTPNVFDGGHDYHSRFEWNTVQNLERSLAFTTALVAYWAEHGAK